MKVTTYEGIVENGRYVRSASTMSTSFEAVYENGMLRPLKPLDLREGTKVALLVIEPTSTKLSAVRAAMNDPLFIADLQEVAGDFAYVDAEVDAR